MEKGEILSLLDSHSVMIENRECEHHPDEKNRIIDRPSLPFIHTDGQRGWSIKPSGDGYRHFGWIDAFDPWSGSYERVPGFVEGDFYV